MRRCAINILAPLLLGACLTHPAAAEEFWLSAELELDPAQQYQTAVFQRQHRFVHHLHQRTIATEKGIAGEMIPVRLLEAAG